MKLAAFVCMGILGLAPPPARAQPQARVQEDAPQAEIVKVELRVTSAATGAAWIDRGSIDGIAEQDRVRFFPRGGGTFEGTVVQVDVRSARVQLHDPRFEPAPGTRGEVMIPSSRLHPPVETAEPEVPPTEPAPEPQPEEMPPEHPPWAEQDKGWSQGMPLLAQVRPMRPEDRPMRVSGRTYALGDQFWTSEESTSDTFVRAGASILYENPFGNGADLHIDGELNYRRTDVADNDDDERTRLRLDRLSYVNGGTRFNAHRVEFGRFLQREMPEFGVLDGIEWSRRESSGNHFGVSAGFLPEPDAEQGSFEDLQIAAFYRWVADESERLTWTTGYQKTFHDYAADRDLVVTRFDYLPVDTWSVRGTAWIDFYTSGDDAKGAGPEVTQAFVTTGRRFEGGSSLNLTYNHLAFPEIDRNEFTPVTDAQLADDHNDRIALDARQQFSQKAALFEEVGVWVDEDDEGADAELGFEVRDVLLGHDSSIGLTMFGADGRYSRTVGYRASLSKTIRGKRWGLDYEGANNRITGFSADNDDLPQHRLRGTLDVYSSAGFNFSGYLEGQLIDDESAAAIGFYLQRNF